MHATVALVLLALVSDAAAVRPADLAPGAPELQEAELRLLNLLDEADAVRAATSRLQAKWVVLGQAVPDEKGKLKAVDPCGSLRVDVAWRIEHFGAAWREAAQAAHAQAGRLQAIRTAATVAPLVDDRWAARLRGLLDQDVIGERAFVEASVWQARFVRPQLETCPATPPPAPAVASPAVASDEPDAAGPVPPNGEDLSFVWERGHRVPPVAILAIGDGYICPGAIRADDAIVLLPAEPTGEARACWSASSSCGCELGAVYPGGVLSGLD